jgi:hypothetical protein
MSAAEALKAARDAGVELRLDGDSLVLEASAPPPVNVLDLLSRHKAGVIALIQQDGDGWSAEDWHAFFEERAAITEYDGRVPRAWAEGFARLDPNRPPIAVSGGRWQAVINGIGLFLDQWAAEAIAKGWGAADIFGADAFRPGVTWLNSGPLWFGDGARVVAVHPDRIELEMQSGERLTYRRRPHMRARALPWEIAR